MLVSINCIIVSRNSFVKNVSFVNGAKFVYGSTTVPNCDIALVNPKVSNAAGSNIIVDIKRGTSNPNVNKDKAIKDFITTGLTLDWKNGSLPLFFMFCQTALII